MNNLTMNSFQSIVYSSLFWITTFWIIYKLVHLFLSIKIHLFLSSINFPQMFSPNFLWKNFSYSKYFAENKKDGNSLLQGLVNMMDEEE